MQAEANRKGLKRVELIYKHKFASSSFAKRGFAAADGFLIKSCVFN